MTYCSKDEVRTELMGDATLYPDALVDSWIAAATKIVDNELNDTFETKKAVTEKYTGEGTREIQVGESVLYLKKRPESVTDITQIKINGVAYTGSKELLDSGKLILETTIEEHDIIEVTFNYGIASVPEDIKRLTILIAANMARNRDQPAVGSINAGGAFSTSFQNLNPQIIDELKRIKERRTVSDARLI
jgi:hypothetical protein